MPLWDKVKQELDRAGQVAQDALDEGRIRLEAHRARQHADKAAEALGYAVYRARQAGAPMDDAELGRHTTRLGEHEAEVERLERELATIQQRWRAGGGMGAPPSSQGASTGSTSGFATSSAPMGGVPDPGPVGTPAATAAQGMPPEASDAPVPPPATPPSGTAVDLDSPSTDPWRPGDVPGREPY